MKKFLLWFGGIFLFFLIIGACNDTKTKSNNTTTASDSSAVSETSEISETEYKPKRSDFNKKGWRVHKKHPEWSVEICNTIGKGEIQIGMDTDMMVAAWGRPSRDNVSNYGNGNEHQYVYEWGDYSMSCVYVREKDGLIYAYN